MKCTVSNKTILYLSGLPNLTHKMFISVSKHHIKKHVGNVEVNLYTFYTLAALRLPEKEIPIPIGQKVL